MSDANVLKTSIPSLKEEEIENNFGSILQLMYLDTPFYSVFLSGIDRRIVYSTDKLNDEIPYAAVGKSSTLSYRLYINARGWNALRNLEIKTEINGLRQDALRHEAQHIAYMHPTLYTDFKYPELFQIAADLVINQSLKNITQYSLTQDPTALNTAVTKLYDSYVEKKMTKEEFLVERKNLLETTDPCFIIIQHYGFVEGLSSFEYYNLLIKLKECQDNCEKTGSSLKNQILSDSSLAKNFTKSLDTDSRVEKNLEGLAKWASKAIKDQDFANFISEIFGNGKWKEFDNKDVNEIINGKLKTNIRAIHPNFRKAGNLPQGLLNHVDSLLVDAIPVVDYKRMLSLLVTKSVEYYTKITRRKLNKRNPEFGAIKIKPSLKIFAVADTSGSMGTEDLQEVFSQIEIIRKKTGATIFLGECDAELFIEDVCKVSKTSMKTKTSYRGGGGTSVEPVINYVNDNPDFSCVIYLTDGYVPVPNVKCKIPMITIIVSNGADPEPLRESKRFGYVLKMIKQ